MNKLHRHDKNRATAQFSVFRGFLVRLQLYVRSFDLKMSSRLKTHVCVRMSMCDDA